MQTIETKLQQAHSLLSHATSDAELLMILTRYGYGMEQLQEGMALYEAARQSAQNQSKAKLSKVTATQAFYEQWRLAKLHYLNDLRVARVALKDKPQATRNFLQLDGTRSNTFGGWLGQVRVFYVGLREQSELLAMTEPFGLTSERIEQGSEFLHNLESFRLQNETEKSSTVDTRIERNESMDALNRWMTTFRQLARIVLAPYPAYLSRLALDAQPRKQKMNELIVPPANSHFEQTASQPSAR